MKRNPEWALPSEITGSLADVYCFSCGSSGRAGREFMIDATAGQIAGSLPNEMHRIEFRIIFDLVEFQFNDDDDYGNQYY